MSRKCPQCGYEFPLFSYYTLYDERNELIRRLYHQQMLTTKELAARYGLCEPYIRKIIGIQYLRRDLERQKMAVRKKAIFAARISGKTFKAIGQEFGITGQRVRQICIITHRRMIGQFWREYREKMSAMQ